MSVLLDTTVVVDVTRGLEVALAFVRGLKDKPVCSEVTRVEVLRGLRTMERGLTERFFGYVEWLPIDELVAQRAGEFGRTWRRRHPGIATSDLIVAASAEIAGLELATLNLKHFPMFKGLRAPY